MNYLKFIPPLLILAGFSLVFGAMWAQGEWSHAQKLAASGILTVVFGALMMPLMIE